MSAVTPLAKPSAAGQMLVSGAADHDMEALDAIVDLDGFSGADLLAKARERERHFGTGPFDPEGKMIRFYPGGITIWSGFPGAGKTTVLRQLVCHLLNRGAGVFLASLEEDPGDVIIRLASTAAGTTTPTAHQVQWFIDAYAARFRLWGQIGLAKHKQLLGAARTLGLIGIQHVVIDSLMCLDIANDDLEAQRQFANIAAATARVAKVHIHLVAHPRKAVSADQGPDLNDVAGAREIGGIADNVLFIRRDPNRQGYTMNAEVTPMCVSVRKQRHFSGALGDIEGWFARPFRQFTRDQFLDRPVRYLPDDAYTEVRA